MAGRSARERATAWSCNLGCQNIREWWRDQFRSNRPSRLRLSGQPAPAERVSPITFITCTRRRCARSKLYPSVATRRDRVWWRHRWRSHHLGCAKGRRIEADERLAQRKFDFDKEIAERKFKYDRELHDHKRKTELAEHGLTAFYEAGRVFVSVRSRGIFGAEGSSRTPAPGETATQQEKRNTYFIPIERLIRDKALFAQLQSLRYAFAAHFGVAATEPFDAIIGVQNEVIAAASTLIQMTHDGDASDLYDRSAQPLLDTLGWGMGKRPDGMDGKIEKAVQDIERLCRPVLSGAPT